MWDLLIVEALYKASVRALPLCYPNPAVGAIFVSSTGKIMGEGHTQPYGEAHAEVIAVREVEKNYPSDVLRDCILYINLTPCCYEGKTPPCIELLLQKGVQKVCIVHDDPNPLVHQKSLQRFKDAGVYVDMNCPQEYIKKFAVLNEIFFSRFSRELPWVTLKYAMTLDGKISTVSGDSKWISCDVSRNGMVQFLRATHGAISVGDNTVLKDNPKLTVRNFSMKNPPTRIIFNTGPLLPVDSQIFSRETKTIVILPFTAKKDYKKRILAMGHEILEVSSSPDLRKILCHFKTQQIDSILLEGGMSLMSWFFREGVIDKVVCFIATKILGSKGMSPFDDANEYLAQHISQSISLQNVSWEKCGETLLVSGYMPVKVSS